MRKRNIFNWLLIGIIIFTNTNCSKVDPQDNITVTPRPGSSSGNIVPEVDAGRDIRLQIPTTSTTLTGFANINNAQYKWKKISGPESYFLEWPDQASAKLIWMEEGEYAFELSVTNPRNGLTGRDTVLVTVSSNLKKLTLTSIAHDSSRFLIAEIPPDVIANIQWVFCKSSGRCERADNGPSPTIDYNWGGYYYEHIPSNKISVFGGYSDIDTVDIIIYYSE